MGRRLARNGGSVRVACPKCNGVVRVEVTVKDGRGALSKGLPVACPRRDCGAMVRLNVSIARGRSVN